MKAAAAYLLLALCLCASSTVISTPPNAPIGAALSEPQYLRSLKDQAAAAADANAAAAATNVDADVKKTAVHRTYDTVTGLYCEKVGVCHVCPASEKDEVYCRETGHRQELSCFKSDTTDANAPDAAKELRFQACEPAEKDHPLLRVVTFEICMAGLLAGAFVLLQRERRKHLSAFDLRKDPRQRSTLLGDKNAD